MYSRSKAIAARSTGNVVALFADAAQSGYCGVTRFESKDTARGRIEYRLVRALPSHDLPPRVEDTCCGLKTAVLVERICADKEVTLDRTYITSHAAEPKPLAARIRGHWSIENQLHHCLDVSFAEDRGRIHDGHGAQNFALVTRYALSLLKREPTNISVAMKRRKAAWGETYLLNVFSAGFPPV